VMQVSGEFKSGKIIPGAKTVPGGNITWDGVDSEVSTEPTDEVKKRWFFWTKLVAAGRKHSYAGLPEVITVRLEDDNGELKPVYDYSGRNGKAREIARRRAKNKVAKNSRKVNR